MKKYELSGSLSWFADYWSDPKKCVSLDRKFKAKNDTNAIKLVKKIIQKYHEIWYRNQDGYEISAELREYRPVRSFKKK